MRLGRFEGEETVDKDIYIVIVVEYNTLAAPIHRGFSIERGIFSTEEIARLTVWKIE